MNAKVLAGVFLCSFMGAAAADESPKRQKLEVLTPVEYRFAYTRASVRSYMLSEDGTKITVILSRGPRKLKAQVEIEELAKRNDVRLAEKVLPLRVVIGVASFPYRKQVEEIQRALALHSLEEARRQLTFAGLNVERRRIGPDGKPLDMWASASVLEAAKILAKASGKRFVDDEPALKPVIIPGLALPLPEQFAFAPPYPRPEAALTHLAESLKGIAQGDRDAKAIPEYCLVRFFDVQVDPGQTYEYRLQVMMADPASDKDKQAVDKPLVSSWVQLPRTISVPSDFAFYAVDQKQLDPKHFPDAREAEREQAAVQLHRWLDFFDPADARNPQPVGGWAIVERVLVYPGEYIGGTHAVELPVWNWFEERSVLGSDPSDRSTKRVPVAFTEENEIAPLLVCFSGGRVEYAGVQERTPRELLVLMPNGRLAARNSAADGRDPERLQRYCDWRRRVDEIKNAGGGRK
jgi:hypothetical protein